MKIGNIEGTPQEIKDFVDNHGCNILAYLQAPEVSLHRVWVFIPAALFFVAIIIQILIDYDWVQSVFPIIQVGIGVWLISAMQLKFKSMTTTMIVSTGLLIIILLSSQFIKLPEIAPLLKSFVKQ